MGYIVCDGNSNSNSTANNSISDDWDGGAVEAQSMSTCVIQVKRLGQGNFGVARLYTQHSTGDKVAAKFLERGEKIDENVLREILNHKQLKHSHIVQFRYSLRDMCLRILKNAHVYAL